MPTRRRLLAGLGATGVIATSSGIAGFATGAGATPELRDKTIAQLTRGAPVSDGRVTLTIPGLAENGLSVYTIVEADSPMSDTDFVRRVHILAERNPIARLLTWELGPAVGRAKVATNIRLAASQQVTALVEMSDGSFWQDRKDVVVTVAACIDGG